MKKICVKYDENGKICDFSNDSLCFEQENKSVHVCALISAEKSVRAYVSSANGNSMVTGEIDPDENGEYLLVIEESYMSKGTLYVAFEEYDAEGYSKRYEPLKIYIDAFVELDEGNSDNVYVVTVNVGQVETLPEGENAYVTNSGSSKDMVLDFGIPAGKPGATPVRGVDYWTEEDKAEIENNVKESLVVDDALSSESENPVQNKVVAEEFGKVRGEMPEVTNDPSYISAGGFPGVVPNVDAVGNFTSQYIQPYADKIMSLETFRQQGTINLVDYPNMTTKNEDTGLYELHYYEDHRGSYGNVRFADEYAREKLSNIEKDYVPKEEGKGLSTNDYHAMEEIYSVTTTEEVSKITISQDKNGNPLNLDEIYIRISLSESLSAVPQHAWGCYMNGGTTAKEVAYFITPNTTGNRFTFHSKRMKNGLWFTQSNNTLVATDYNQAWYGNYVMSGINYINKLSFNVYDIPVGSTITICGREASK